MKNKSYVWGRLELTALAVESPRLDGAGVAAPRSGRSFGFRPHCRSNGRCDRLVDTVACGADGVKYGLLPGRIWNAELLQFFTLKLE